MADNKREQILAHVYSPADINTIRPFLESRLPQSINILRRLEKPLESASSFLIATFPPGNVPLSDEGPFALGLFDTETPPPGTGGWLVSSLDFSDKSIDHAPEGGGKGSVDCRHIIALLQFVKRRKANDKSSDSHLIKLGSVHENTTSVLQDAGLLHFYDKSQTLLPFGKYLFRSSGVSTGGSEEALPTGLIFDRIQADEYETVVATNPFAYSPDILKRFENVAVREQQSGRLAAWAFRGLDGSIRTLHCESHWRRKGLARAVIAKLVGDHVSRSKDGADVWEHVDIEDTNVPSVKLFQGFGAAWRWTGFWIVINLSRLD